jgi:hypothetical protein
MIRKFVLVMFLISSFLRAYSSFQPNIGADSCFCKIEIVKIEKDRGFWIIHSIIEKDSRQIAIISPKHTYRKGEKLKVGRKYTIQINPYFKEDMFPDHLVLFEIILDGKILIVPSKGWVSNVYTSPDLVGLRIK